MKRLLAIPFAVLAIEPCHAVSLISLDFSGAMTSIQQQTFIDAADYWNSAITGYDLTLGYHPDNSAYPDRPHSLTITVSLPAIDGVNGILGSAGPTTASYYDDNPIGAPTVALYYATTGTMQFDVADVDSMVTDNTFYGVVLHEMAHVLGIGTLWVFNTVNGTIPSLYVDNTGQYTGANALANWKSEFNRPGDIFVPVELAGGAGTANGHWNETDGGNLNTGIISVDTGMDFKNELMTGWASSNFFISRTTLGSLDDLGYIVDYTKAGVVNHIVAIPEWSSANLCLVAAAMAFRRRR